MFNLVTMHTASCCGKIRRNKHSYYLELWLLRHINRSHKYWSKIIERRAIIMARSQNGCGYSDYKGEGWRKAGKDFKLAWRILALRDWLNNRKR
jgi:hypothetical protein